MNGKSKLHQFAVKKSLRPSICLIKALSSISIAAIDHSILCSSVNRLSFQEILLCVALHSNTSSYQHNPKVTMDAPVAPVALNIAPLNAPQRELEWQPLANLDYQISEEMLMHNKYHIHLLNELKIKHETGTDVLGIWDSFLPIFKLPQVNQFPDLIHLCADCYDATQRAVIDSSGSVVFYVTPGAIREMLHFKT